MKRWIQMILGTVLSVICMMTVSVPAFAAENPGVTIPVSVSLSGTLPKPAEDFTIKLKADDVSYPMPEGSAGDVYTMTITGADAKNLPTISYSRVGVYTYTIYQTAGNNKECTYDNTVYTLTVYITNAEDGSGLEVTAVLYPDSEGDKQSGVEFKNVYGTVETKPPVTPEPPKTGDESTPIRYVIMIAVSMGMIAALVLVRRKRKKEN